MSHRRLGATLACVAAALPLAAPAVAPAQSKKAKRDLTVMTRNVYVGADLIPLATQPSREAFEQAAAGVYQTLVNNDFQTRAKALAREIRQRKPDVVGLQEAARWMRGPDGLKDGSTTPANDVIYDSTEVLLQELNALGQRYRVVASRDWFDFEGPTALGFDARIIQRDAIIVRAGSKVRVGRSFRGGFRDTFDPPTPIGVARQLRGWVGFDGRIGGRRFRFVTTHLEAYNPEIGDQQMRQLLAGPLASKKRQSILMGDFNSDPRSAQTDDRGAARQPNAYASSIAAGFRNPLPRRATCCFAEDLRQTTEPLDSWIDHIVVRPRARVLRSGRVGAAASERTGGLWPSDHAGIWAKLRLR